MPDGNYLHAHKMDGYDLDHHYDRELERRTNSLIRRRQHMENEDGAEDLLPKVLELCRSTGCRNEGYNFEHFRDGEHFRDAETRDTISLNLCQPGQMLKTGLCFVFGDSMPATMTATMCASVFTLNAIRATLQRVNIFVLLLHSPTFHMRVTGFECFRIPATMEHF